MPVLVGAVRTVDGEIIAIGHGLGEALVRQELDGANPVVQFWLHGPGIGWHGAAELDSVPFEAFGAELPLAANLDDALGGCPSGLGAEVEAFVPETGPMHVLVVVDAEADAVLGGVGTKVGGGFVGMVRLAGSENDGNGECRQYRKS